MKVIVQKFGGTSVVNKEKRLNCLTHIKNELDKQYKVVVVVSAMGRKGDHYSTDTLLSLLGEDAKINNKNRDLLLSTGEIISACLFSNLLSEHNIKNTVLTGGEAGIITDENFNNANITRLNPTLIKEELQHNEVVIVTGFQGKTENGNITTLGRGGSDTTATALGSTLNADFVDIFTDVEGIYTADPQIVEDARAIPVITYTEICNLAHLGAKVIHPRAVEIAMQKNTPIRVRSTFSNGKGTLVTNITEMERSKNKINDKLITGITQTNNLSQIKVLKKEKDELFPSNILKKLKENNISIDLINITINEITFTVPNTLNDQAKHLINNLNYECEVNNTFAKISIVGANISGVPGVMASISSTLQSNGINIYQSSDSHTTIWILVEEKHMRNSIRLLHQQFLLN